MTWEGFGPSQIERELYEQRLNGIPEIRTIQRIAKKYRRDDSGPWSFAGADPEEARHVLDVLAWIFEFTAGRVWLTNDEAEHVARVREAVPDIPPLWAYGIARAYRVCEAQGRAPHHVDLALGKRPWESMQNEESLSLALGAPQPSQRVSVLTALWAYEGSLADLEENLSQQYPLASAPPDDSDPH